MPDDCAIDRLLGLDLYGIPLRPWYLTGHGCPAMIGEESGCCAGGNCACSPVQEAASEFATAMTWSEVAEIVELCSHERKLPESEEHRSGGSRETPEIPHPHEPEDVHEEDDGIDH